MLYGIFLTDVSAFLVLTHYKIKKQYIPLYRSREEAELVIRRREKHSALPVAVKNRKEFLASLDDNGKPIGKVKL